MRVGVVVVLVGLMACGGRVEQGASDLDAGAPDGDGSSVDASNVGPPDTCSLSYVGTFDRAGTCAIDGPAGVWYCPPHMPTPRGCWSSALPSDSGGEYLCCKLGVSPSGGR